MGRVITGDKGPSVLAGLRMVLWGLAATLEGTRICTLDAVCEWGLDSVERRERLEAVRTGSMCDLTLAVEDEELRRPRFVLRMRRAGSQDCSCTEAGTAAPPATRVALCVGPRAGADGARSSISFNRCTALVVSWLMFGVEPPEADRPAPRAPPAVWLRPGTVTGEPGSSCDCRTTEGWDVRLPAGRPSACAVLSPVAAVVVLPARGVRCSERSASLKLPSPVDPCRWPSVECRRSLHTRGGSVWQKQGCEPVDMRSVLCVQGTSCMF